jgi:hypothetical protein
VLQPRLKAAISKLAERIMSDSHQHDNGISRRMVITGTAIAVGATAIGAASTRAEAQTKISQANAKYQEHPNGTQECDGCIQFQAPNACKIVEGPINPKGWCQFFGAKS